MKTYFVLFLYSVIPLLSMAQWFPSANLGSSINSASFLSKDSFILSNNGQILITNNGGVSFDSLANFPTQAAYNMVYKSKDTLFIARETTKGLLVSYDAGISWQTQTLLLPNGDTAFLKGKILYFGFFDENHGIVFGDTLKGIQQVFLTSDGGINWLFYTHPSIIQSIQFSISYRPTTFKNKCVFSNGFGKFLIGDENKLLTLSNYGKNWYTDTLLPSNKSYRSIAFKDEQNGLSRISGKLCSTTNGGLSWVEINDSLGASNGNLVYVNSTANKTGFYLASTPLSIGLSNASFDNGITWQVFDSINHGGGSVFFKDAEAGVCTEVAPSPTRIFYYKPSFANAKEVTNYKLKNLVCYPNPTSDLVYFTETYSTIEIWDVQGKLIKSVKQVSSIDLSDELNGVYILNLTDKKGFVSQKKLIVQH